ncbi:MAG TPA: hypothetical protein VF593_07200 [Chthoniobacteraceae bacterium]|jgi:hypothetical protein
MKALFYSVLTYWGAFILLLKQSRHFTLSDSAFFTLLALYALGFPLMLFCSWRLWRHEPRLARVGVAVFVALAILTWLSIPSVSA